MRAGIGFLILVMLILLGNIIAYSASEEYRFFLKKLKYPEELVYTQNPEVSDSEKITIIDLTPEQLYTNDIVEPSQEDITFLDVLTGTTVIKKENILPELIPDEQWFLDEFLDSYELSQIEDPSSLFDITTEYPDPYYTWYNEDISVYIFSTKSYQQVKNIFLVLSEELPFSVNEVNNFWQHSFYINLDEIFADEYVRIVMEYKSKAFWLKIKKDLYNEVKPILETF